MVDDNPSMVLMFFNCCRTIFVFQIAKHFSGLVLPTGKDSTLTCHHGVLPSATTSKYWESFKAAELLDLVYFLKMGV